MSTFSLVVAAPPPAVFDYLAEPRNRPEWQSSLRAVELLTDGPTGVGTRWLDRTAVGARPALEIVEMRRPTDAAAGVWAEVGEWHGLRAELSLRFEPLTGSPTTLVSGKVSLDGSPAWLPVRVVLTGLAPGAVKADLRRAARLLEARSAR
jgi:uncharacterized protein YndB with AHSA1/START domain